MNHMTRAQPHAYMDRCLAQEHHRNPLQQQQQQQQQQQPPQPQTSAVTQDPYCDVTYQQSFEPVLRLEATQQSVQLPPARYGPSLSLHQQRQQSPGYSSQQQSHHIHQHQLAIHHQGQQMTIPVSSGQGLTREQLQGADGYDHQRPIVQESSVIYEPFEAHQPATQEMSLGREPGDPEPDHIYAQQHQQQVYQHRHQLPPLQVHQTMTPADTNQLAGYEGQSYAIIYTQSGYVQQEASLISTNQFNSIQDGMIQLNQPEGQQYQQQQYSYQEPTDDYGIGQSDDGLGGDAMCQAHLSQQQTMVQARSSVYQQQIPMSHGRAYYEPEQMDVHPTIKQQHQMMHRKQMLQVGPTTGQLPAGHIHHQQTMGHHYQVEAQPVCEIVPQPPPQQIKEQPMGKLAPSHEFGRAQHRYQSHQPQPPGVYLGHGQNPHDCIISQQQRMRLFPDLDGPKQITKHKGHDLVDFQANGGVSSDRLDTICRHLIEHMNRFGICVIDNFLGALKGESILEEVKKLYSRGQYSRGRLVSNKMSLSSSSTNSSSSSSPSSGASSSPLSASGSIGASPSRAAGQLQSPDGCMVDEIAAIRNDRVIWIDGYEDGCSEINNLIQILCSVITNSARLSLYSNNALDKVVINKRTKAHVACYPGNGTRYIKHVDNPNGDGRLITSIYYLNKDWNAKRDGGLLRMFPVGMDQVANIEPLFDRVLFFWSDRRNPHEVLPAYKDRFAITVWYIGETRA